MVPPPAAARSAEPAALLDQVRAEARTALGLAALLGGAATVFTLGALWLKLSIFTLVVPTNSLSSAVGLAIGVMIMVGLLVALDHLRDLALLAAGHRLARRLSGPAVLALAARAGQPSAASASLLNDVDEVRRGLAGTLCATVLDAALVPATLLLLWLLHPWFGLLALLSCALAAVASVLGAAQARRALRESNMRAAATAGLVADATRCAEAVEAMGLRPALTRRWRGELQRSGAKLQRAQEVGRRLGSALSGLQGLAAGSAMLMGAWLSLRGVDLGGGLMAAMLLTGRVIEPFARLGGSLQDFGATAAAWGRLTAVLAAPAPRADGLFGCGEGRLTLERLTYLHPGTPRPLLREVDLVVEPGEVVGLTGASGAGKTTLLRLLLGMERPTAGGVFLDGHATWQWERTALAHEIGYLPQDPHLGEGTVAEAIARLAVSPDPAAVRAAARLAGVDQMIVALPLGYDTPVHGGGDSALSAGQRQRIALARAVYGQPRLVLLDEPTAWLDAAGEAAVLQLIARLRAERVAVVLSAHRPAVLDAADRILVLAGGLLRRADAGATVVPLAARGAA